MFTHSQIQFVVRIFLIVTKRAKKKEKQKTKRGENNRWLGQALLEPQLSHIWGFIRTMNVRICIGLSFTTVPENEMGWFAVRVTSWIVTI